MTLQALRSASKLISECFKVPMEKYSLRMRGLCRSDERWCAGLQYTCALTFLRKRGDANLGDLHPSGIVEVGKEALWLKLAHS